MSVDVSLRSKKRISVQWLGDILERDHPTVIQAHKSTENGHNVTKDFDDRKFPNIYVKEHVMQILKSFILDASLGLAIFRMIRISCENV